MKELRTLRWLAASCALTAAPLQAADVWVLDPSISLDQRFDDNYFLEPTDDGDLNATNPISSSLSMRETVLNEAFTVSMSRLNKIRQVVILQPI